jgi:hypothetical protein
MSLCTCMRISISCIISLLLLLPSAAAASPAVSETCFSQALLASQSCSNHDLQYTPLLGYAGLGSEFEWLMTALLYAVMHHRRLVHLETPLAGRVWPYSCPAQRGWNCYLAMDRCPPDPPPSSLHSNSNNSPSTNNSILLRKGRKVLTFLPVT